MISEEKVRLLIEEQVEGGPNFLVALHVGTDNVIDIVMDGDEGFSIQECINLNRYLERTLDRDIEDFNIKVSSPGLDQPFKVRRQYYKNVGRNVKVTLNEGEVIEGELMSVDDDHVVVRTRVKERIEGRKAKHWVETDHSIGHADILATKVIISFK
ncbi:MAG: ribosome assembly cofactor RimP [Flavobacteriales bacterium]|nr:ribosome assembly cofactor RimP [Flavobacteriales bacterium]